MKGHGGSSSSRGGASGSARVPRGSEDGSSGSDSILGSPEPHGDVLGRPTVDPWYRSSERFPSVPASLQPPPADWEWLVLREDATADTTWTPDFQEIRDLQIQRNEMLAVPLVFDFQCSRAIEWADWIDSELADRGFCDHLEQAGVLRSILISRCSNMFRDTEALRQLVRRWCPSTHTFFFAHGELTVTLEDVENHWLLPILGDQDPAEIALSPEESKIEAVLADYIGRKNVALGTQAARFNSWMEHFLRIEDSSIRRAAFISYWLSKCVFGEHPAYSIKPLYFCLAVKIAAGVRFPLAPLLLGQLYTQLDLLHAEELVGASCHIVSTAFNSSVVHTFVWEHTLEYIRKGKKPYEIRKKFASMPEGVVTNVGDFQGDVPAVFRWVGNKFYDHGLIPSLDSEGKVCWRPYGITHRSFVYESVMSGFRDVEAQDYTLIAGDVASLTYLSATNAGWLPVPAVMGVAAGEIPTINPFLRARAFAYWSGVAPRVIVPNGNRIGVFTAGMANYWRELMAAMVEFKDSGREDTSHLLESYTSPLPHPRLFGATNTMTTYANRQRLGYAVWHHEDSRWVIYGNHHPPLWLRDHPHIAAPGKVPSSRGKRNASAGTPTAVKRKQPDRSKKGEAVSKDSPAQASKRDPVPADETAAEGVSAPMSKGPIRKTRAGKKTFVPPAFPSTPASIAARVAARKSGRGIVYSEKRSKQRADTAARVPVEISDDLSSTSSSGGEGDVSGAAAKGAEDEDVEAAIAEETESESVEVTAAEEAESEDVETAAEGTEVKMLKLPLQQRLRVRVLKLLLQKQSLVQEKDMEAGANIEDDEVSTGELGATGAASDSGSTASASKTMSAEEVVEEHVTVGVVTGVERVVEPTPITVTSSGGTAQGDASESGSQVDPSLLDSSPSTRQYVRRARRGSLVSTDSERTASVTARVSTPPSPLGDHCPKRDETAPVITEEVPSHAEVLAHTPEVPRAEVAASDEPVQADVIPGSGVPVIEEELAQDPADDVDMADTHDSYDEAWVDAADNMAGDQAADMEVTAPVAAQISPTRTARSSHGIVIEEGGRLQAAAVEFAVRGQPGPMSAARPVTSRTSVLADMDAFFQEFERTSFSSRHAEHFWTFDDAKADFEVFRVPRGGIRFLQALWGKYGSCSSYFSRGVHVGSSLLTLLCCVLAHMEHTRLGDITEVHILEWKAVVQEAIEGGFKFGFILDYLRRLARDIFSRRVLVELREAEVRVAALRDALNAVAPSPWDLASARRASAEARTESALHGLLS
uniref:Aminotransferase-like plant mobile domain-containing protein n=1 Tax=Fagus sylvatica TaxID=28930 RepID=A0A2N9GWQ1_FAGSY